MSANNAAQAIAQYSFESYSNLFEPDVILPGQFSHDEKGLRGGERRLMAALLSDGIESYIAQCTGETGLSQKMTDAREWVETKDLNYVFSFDMVCECLGINADYLRQGLMGYVALYNASLKENSRKPAWKKIRRPRKR